MRSWEEVGVVCKEVNGGRVRENIIAKNIYAKNIFGKNIFRKNIFRKNIFGRNIFRKNIFAKNIFKKNIFAKNIVEKIFSKRIFLSKIFFKKLTKNIFKKNTYAKYFSKKKRWRWSPPCCPQGLGWYRAIARSQPSMYILYCNVIINLSFCTSTFLAPQMKNVSFMREAVVPTTWIRC